MRTYVHCSSVSWTGRTYTLIQFSPMIIIIQVLMSAQ